MRVLLTGGLGNIGRSALDELVRRGHQVRCFDLRTRANRIAVRKLQGEIEVVWGDLRRPADVAAAVQDQDIVVHLAFIIPKMSATGVESEKRPDWARAINIGGTRNLLDAMRTLPKPPKLIFASSYHVYGLTQHLPPPRTLADPIHPTEYYARHKAACERLVRASGLPYAILRLAAALPLAIQLDPGMFDVPLDNRMEFVHTRDVGIAVANGVISEGIWGRTLLIGGGNRCQYFYREIVERILEAMGVGMLPEEAFGSKPFATDWVDSSESQRLLRYQHRDLGDYITEMVDLLGFKRRLVRWTRPVLRRWLLLRSPYYRRSRAKGLTRKPVPSSAP
jgi:nucleoside-diphosphate-sugar epimerase